MKINFYNNTKYNIFKYERLIKRTFRPFNVKKSFDLIFVDIKEIQRINKEFRNKDVPTDVISFAYVDDDENDIASSLGEIFICVEKAYEQAKEYKHSNEREFLFLAVHGYLHLCGFDHMTKEDEEVMFKIQDDILEKAGFKRWIKNN